jgi:neutral trehalase
MLDIVTGEERPMPAPAHEHTTAATRLVPTPSHDGDLATRARAVLDRNWTGTFTLPAPELYPHQWNWDSGFIAIGYAGYDTQRAMAELYGLFHGQWANGMLPHIVFHRPSQHYFPDAADWQATWAPDAAQGVSTSGITQPPIHATAVRVIVERASRKLEALKFLEDVFPTLLSSHRFLHGPRDPNRVGLAVCVHPWETGIDNSPKWDAPLQAVDGAGLPDPTVWRRDLDVVGADQRPDDEAYRRFIQLMELFREWHYDAARMAEQSPFRVYDVLFNSVLHRADRDLLYLAEILGESAGEIRDWIRTTSEAFETLLWHSDDAMYHSYDVVAGGPIPVHTASCALPLFAGIPTAKRARALADGMFATCAFGEPEVCASVPSYHDSQEGYQATNYWRGPVWMNVNWMLYRGLRGYRLLAPAAHIRRNMLRLVEKAGFWEYYHPTEVRGLGSSGFSWSAALTLDLLSQADSN